MAGGGAKPQAMEKRFASCLRQIDPARVKGVASGNPLHPAPCPSNGPILPHSLNEIIAAGRLKPALTAYQRAERPLIDSCGTDEQCGRQMPKLSAETIHDRLPPPRPARSSILLWTPADSAINDSRICSSDGGDWPRTTQTRSSGGRSACVNRKASRNNRFHRLRSTAPPTRRETVKPIRGCLVWLGAP